MEGSDINKNKIGYDLVVVKAWCWAQRDLFYDFGFSICLKFFYNDRFFKIALEEVYQWGKLADKAPQVPPHPVFSPCVWQSLQKVTDVNDVEKCLPTDITEISISSTPPAWIRVTGNFPALSANGPLRSGTGFASIFSMFTRSTGLTR